MQIALGTPDRIQTIAVQQVSRFMKKAPLWITLLLSLLAPLQVLAQKSIFVDARWKQVPFVPSTIQDAVAKASAGDTIFVFPGEYLGTVNIVGHAKDGLRIIAVGTPEEVIVQGDHKQRDGFYLEDVDRVLIQGFTIQDFGSSSTTATAAGVGNNIYLLRSHFNTIRHNRITLSDKMGIMLQDSADNLVEENLVWNIDPKGIG